LEPTGIAQPVDGEQPEPAVEPAFDVRTVFCLAWRCYRRAFVIAIIYGAASFGLRTVARPFNLLMIVNGSLTLGDWTLVGITVLAFVYLEIGLRRIVLDAGRGREIAISRLFAPAGDLLRVVAVGVPTTLMVLLGFALLVVPGLFLYGVFSQTVNLIIDGRARLFDAIEKSWFMARNNLARIVVTVLLASLISLPGHIVARMAAGSMAAGGSERFFATFAFILGTSWEMLGVAFTTFVIVAVYLTLLRCTDVEGYRVRAVDHSLPVKS
jgi:hypothetical protein